MTCRANIQPALFADPAPQEAGQIELELPHDVVLALERMIAQCQAMIDAEDKGNDGSAG